MDKPRVLLWLCGLRKSSHCILWRIWVKPLLLIRLHVPILGLSWKWIHHASHTEELILDIIWRYPLHVDDLIIIFSDNGAALFQVNLFILMKGQEYAVFSEGNLKVIGEVPVLVPLSHLVLLEGTSHKP